MRKFFAGSLLFLLLAGCAGWKPADGPFTSDACGYSVRLPIGWMFEHQSGVKTVLVFRKYAYPLGRIYIEAAWIEKKESPAYKRDPILDMETAKDPDKGEFVKKKIKKDMPPLEIAEIIVEDLRSTNLNNFKLLEMSPASISGRRGSKVVFTIKGQNGPRMKAVVYAFLEGERLYEISLFAPQRYYYDLYIQDFENMVASFSLGETRE